MLVALLVALVVALLVSIAMRFQHRGPFLQYLFLARYSALVSLTLVGSVPIALWGVPSLLRSLLVLRLPDIALVTWLALLAAWSVMLTTRIVLMYADERLGVPMAFVPRWMIQHQVPLYGALALPLVVAIVAVSPGLLWQRVVAVAVGVSLAGMTLAVSTWVRERLLAPEAQVPDLLLNTNRAVFQAARRKRVPAIPGLDGFWECIRWLFRKLGPGYVDEQGEVLSGHVVALIFFLVILVIYFVGYVGLRPDMLAVPVVPALGYLLIVLVILSWGLADASFLLDKYRAPTGFLVVLVSFTVSFAFDSDHYYERFPGPIQSRSEQERVAAIRRVVERWMGDKTPPMVVVAASGGGIQGAAWTARVLAGLQEDCGPGFAKSIALVSAVSGGSMGAMYFVDHYAPGGFPSDPALLAAVVQAAEHSSLDEAGWGVAYPDLLRVLLPFLVQPKTIDRGWALEQAWKRQLTERRGKPDRLSDWRQGVEEGWRPLAVFNATLVESGERFLLAPFDLPTHWGRNFFAEYPGRDVDLVSAVRLSATFPYVTPVARGQEVGDHERPDFHIADGGYYDNFGVVTALQWIEDTIGIYASRGGRKILLLQIRSSPTQAPAGAKSRRGWILDAMGPVMTLMNVRTEAQIFRNDREVELVREKYSRLPLELRPAAFVVRRDGPLSWKLTKLETDAIEDEWKRSKDIRSWVREFLSDVCG